MKKNTRKPKNAAMPQNAIPASMTPQAILKKAISFNLRDEKHPNFEDAYKASLKLKFYYDLDEKYLKLKKSTSNDWVSFFDFFQHVLALSGDTNLEKHIDRVRECERKVDLSEAIDKAVNYTGVLKRLLNGYKKKSDPRSLLELIKIVIVATNGNISDLSKEGWYQMLDAVLNQMGRDEALKAASDAEKS